MSAEQIWDSLLTLTIPSPDSRKSDRFNYDIQSNSDPAAIDHWETIANDIPGQAGATTYPAPDPAIATSSQRYYRVVLQAPL